MCCVLALDSDWGQASVAGGGEKQGDAQLFCLGGSGRHCERFPGPAPLNIDVIICTSH